VSSEGTGVSQLLESISSNMAEAIRRAMRVASMDDSGDLVPLSQTDLAEQSKVGRSTLAKCLSVGPDNPTANLTLEVLCRLADTLGVPPAFLLMRPKDWACIATATETFVRSLSSPKFADKISDLYAMESTTSPDIAREAIELGLLLNTVDADREHLPPEVRESRRAAKVSTAAVAAAIPFRYDGVSKHHMPVLLTLCGIVGTTTARN